MDRVGTHAWVRIGKNDMVKRVLHTCKECNYVSEWLEI